MWINEFHLDAERIASQNVIELFQESFLRVWQGDAEDDPFNRLVLLAELSWRQVSLLRAYAKYYRQTGTSFSPYYIADTLVANPTIAKMLVVFFEEKFDFEEKGSDYEPVILTDLHSTAQQRKIAETWGNISFLLSIFDNLSESHWWHLLNRIIVYIL